MGTSSLEGTELIMRVIAEVGPRSILDVGCGAGRYGFLCREKLDGRTWMQRLSTGSDVSKVRLDAIEIFPGNITPLHRLIYDDIHIGDIRELVADLDIYDVVLMGDVIEHLEKDHGYPVLDKLLQKTRQAIIIVTPAFHLVQGSLYGNEAERHLSFWQAKDFQRYPLSVVQVVGQERGRPKYVTALCRDKRVFDTVRTVLVPGFRERFKTLVGDLVGARRANSILRALRWKGAY